MPDFVVQRVSKVMNKYDKPLKGARILVLGIAYKKDVDDNRESPAFEVIQLLSNDGAIISYNDPHIPRCAGMRHTIQALT